MNVEYTSLSASTGEFRRLVPVYLSTIKTVSWGHWYIGNKGNRPLSRLPTFQNRVSWVRRVSQWRSSPPPPPPHPRPPTTWSLDPGCHRKCPCLCGCFYNLYLLILKTAGIVSSVRSSNSHTDLLLTHHQPLFQITPVLNTGLSLSEPLQLYKGYNAI